MKSYLFEITEGTYEGEQFIVGAESSHEARTIAHDIADKVRFICHLTEEEAESSGLDEY